MENGMGHKDYQIFSDSYILIRILHRNLFYRNADDDDPAFCTWSIVPRFSGVRAAHLFLVAICFR